MSLKKFTDFENSVEEEDKNALANDFKSASRDLIAGSEYITAITKGNEPDEVIIEMGEFKIAVKVKGYVVV